jgi:hypothetical protein
MNMNQSAQSDNQINELVELSFDEMSAVVGGSGILGLGDTGGQNRDESNNQNLSIFGDSILSGQTNTFTPSASIRGIDGVGLSVRV